MNRASHFRRPMVDHPRARQVLEWTDVAFYVCVRVLYVVALVELVVHGTSFLPRL